MGSKVTSALQLGKYKPDDIAFWIVSRQLYEDTEIQEEDVWALEGIEEYNLHPKVLYERKIVDVWRHRSRLPKLHACDFQIVVDLLTCELCVEQFKISKVVRCQNTGEYLYANDTGVEWMPQSYLFATRNKASRELARVKAMIKKWASK